MSDVLQVKLLSINIHLRPLLPFKPALNEVLCLQIGLSLTIRLFNIVTLL